MRARGTRSADGSELDAGEVVSGTFRNIAGPIVAIDSSNNSMTVKDLIGKANVIIKISADSQMKKLPAEMAQRIAMRFKAGAARAQAGSTASRASASGSPSAAANPRATDSRGPESQGTGGSGQGAASTDFQRLPQPFAQQFAG